MRSRLPTYDEHAEGAEVHVISLGASEPMAWLDHIVALHGDSDVVNVSEVVKQLASQFSEQTVRRIAVETGVAAVKMLPNGVDVSGRVCDVV